MHRLWLELFHGALKCYEAYFLRKKKKKEKQKKNKKKKKEKTSINIKAMWLRLSRNLGTVFFYIELQAISKMNC